MSCSISLLWLWHSYRFSNPFKERMTHLFAANSCGERRHTTLPADPISPALPIASASKTFPRSWRQGDRRGQEPPARTLRGLEGGTRRGPRRGPLGMRPEPGGRLQPWPEEGKESGDQGLRTNAGKRQRFPAFRFPEGLAPGRCFSKQTGFL